MSTLSQIGFGMYTYEGRALTIAKVILDGQRYINVSALVGPNDCIIHSDKFYEFNGDLAAFAKFIKFSGAQCKSHYWSSVVLEDRILKSDAGINELVNESYIYGLQLGVSNQGPAPCPTLCSYGEIKEPDPRINDVKEVYGEIRSMHKSKKLNIPTVRINNYSLSIPNGREPNKPVANIRIIELIDESMRGLFFNAAKGKNRN